MTNPQTAAPGVAVDDSALGHAIMEHLGPAALTGGKMSVLEAFELGWKARATEISRLMELLTRYRNETPLGHQPHMIAHEVDEALSQSRTALLAGAAGGEPVAWRRQESGNWVYYETKAWDDLEPLYTAPPAPVVAQGEVTDATMQGLAAYLRCEAGGLPDRHPSWATLNRWANEVDAASRQGTGALPAEPEGDVQLRACDPGTGREYYIKSGPRAELQAEADRMNALDQDYFLVPPYAPAHAPLGGGEETVPAADYEGVMRMLAEQRAKNSALASLILDNDRAGAVKWASGMTTDGSAIWPDTPPLQAQDAKDADRMRFLAQRGGLVVSVDDVASVELLGGTDSEGEQIVTVYQGPTLRVAVDAAMSGKAPAVSGGEPIDMVLHCPKCGKQHIDAPEDAECDGEVVHSAGWNNPPHKSHLCHGCGHIWRPADIPTNGVQAVKTKGKDDSAPPSGGGVQVDAARHFVVLSPDGNEGVIFSSEQDAKWTSTGNGVGFFGIPALGEMFRDLYDEDTFKIVEIAAIASHQAGVSGGA